jgi:hypothetical protein
MFLDGIKFSEKHKDELRLEGEARGKLKAVKEMIDLGEDLDKIGLIFGIDISVLRRIKSGEPLDQILDEVFTGN